MTRGETRNRTPFPVKLQLYGLMFLQYFIEGCYLPIISLYLQEALGFDSKEIGYFGAALAAGPLVAPFILGQLVDRHLATQHVLAVSHLLGGFVMLVLYVQTGGFWTPVILGTIYSILYVPTRMLANSLTFHHLKDRDREFPFVRLWGTIGFIFPAWLVELWWLRGLEADELDQARGVVLALAGIAGLVLAGYSLALPKTPPPGRETRDFAPGRVVGLLRLRSFLVLVLVTFGIAIVHKCYFVWNSLFLRAILDRGGVAGAWEQRLSSLGQIAEIAVLAAVAFAVVRLGFKRTMLIGVGAYLARYLIFAGGSLMEEPFGLLMALVCVGQALHGVCFGCFLAVAYMYVDRVSPVDVRGSMQNFYGTFVVGLGFFVGGFAAGWVGDGFTSRAGEPTLRSALGVESARGLMSFTSAESNQELVRDWPGIWLSFAAFTLLCGVVFVAFFPRADPGEER